MVITSIIAMFVMSWRLSLLALVVAPLLIGLLQPILRKLRKGHNIDTKANLNAVRAVFSLIETR